jgi:hypothetical protein
MDLQVLPLLWVDPLPLVNMHLPLTDRSTILTMMLSSLIDVLVAGDLLGALRRMRIPNIKAVQSAPNTRSGEMGCRFVFILVQFFFF